MACCSSVGDYSFHETYILTNLLSTGRSGPGDRRLVRLSSIDFRLGRSWSASGRPSRSVSELEPGRLGPVTTVLFLPDTESKAEMYYYTESKVHIKGLWHEYSRDDER